MVVKRDTIECNYQQWKHQTLHFHKRLAVLIGGQNTGKSYLLKILYKQLQTNTAKLLWNHTPISNDLFNPILITDQLLLETDLKINRRSYLKHQLLSYINDKVDHSEKFKSLDEHFNNFKKTLHEIINDQFLAPINNPAGDYIKAQISDGKLETYLEKMMSLTVVNDQQVIDPDDYSIDQLKQIWVNLLIHTRTSRTHRSNILLIDDVASNTSPPTWVWLVQKIRALIATGNWYVVLTCKNPLFLKLLEPDWASMNFIKPDFKIVACDQERLVTNFILTKTFLDQPTPRQFTFSAIKTNLPQIITTVDCRVEYQLIKTHLWPTVLALMLNPVALDYNVVTEPTVQALTYAVALMLRWPVTNDEQFMT